ncbi:MAG TPA: O-methyltransferase [Bacteroidetes bacterium]|nr:O-methyltransferase [Bacteroidota bacterium]
MEFIDPALQRYSERFSSPESPVLAELNRETNLKVLYPRMLSGHLQGRILALLSLIKRPQHILEIGTYTGYAAICMAEGLVAEGQVTTIEIDPEKEDLILRYFEKAGIQARANLLIGDAADLIPTIDTPIDLAFLDADKESYVRYFDMILPKMPSGGLIIADNMLWSGKVLDENVSDRETQGLRNFVEHVANTENVEQVLMPVRDGIMLIVKK